MIPLWKAGPALACGNAFILKPSERDPRFPSGLPSCSSRLAYRPASSRLCRATRKRSTPSWPTRTSKPSASSAAPTSRSTSTRPRPPTENVRSASAARRTMIVMPDADLDQAVDALIGAGYGSAGSAAWQSASPFRSVRKRQTGCGPGSSSESTTSGSPQPGPEGRLVHW